MCATNLSASRAPTSTCAPDPSFLRRFHWFLGLPTNARQAKLTHMRLALQGPGANKPPLHAATATAGTAHGGRWHAWVKRCEHPRGGGGGKARAPARASRTNNVSIILASI